MVEKTSSRDLHAHIPQLCFIRGDNEERLKIKTDQARIRQWCQVPLSPTQQEDDRVDQTLPFSLLDQDQLERKDRKPQEEVMDQDDLERFTWKGLPMKIKASMIIINNSI